MTPHPIFQKVTASPKMIPSLVLERVTPDPRITPREPLAWAGVMANAEWEWAIPTSMMTPRWTATLPREDRIARLGVNATLGG